MIIMMQRYHSREIRASRAIMSAKENHYIDQSSTHDLL